jgi:hypothetical protein
MPGSSDLSLITDNVGKGRFSTPCHRSELIGSGIRHDLAVHDLTIQYMVFLDLTGISSEFCTCARFQRVSS